MSRFFQSYYDLLMGPLERRRFKAIRQELISKASGLVLEVGSGTGVNFPYYHNVEKVISIEPGRLMREQSIKKKNQAQVAIEILDASAESLPFPDNYFDSVVATLVFCTIPHPELALQEVKRVCKPHAQVLFFEHVRLDNKYLGKLQDWLTPAWSRLCDGCELNRNTVSKIERAGFQIKEIDSYYKDIFVAIQATKK
ncbi:class I SAM-dependent methyltransferase [Ammoniphilus sp. 3BR4]|uniref:class I SAM-dependent methyltransferase n=1 Tax=Ammoniphilus sp. 3BR4 TaxID=3158265 RepID=UPI0034658BC3